MTPSGAWLALPATALLYLAYRTYRVYLEHLDAERRQLQTMSELHLATIEALALAIDAKNQTTENHVRLVRHYANGLARALGMSEGDVSGIRTAALLHDIGKLAVPEHIIAKPGPLTPEELLKVRIHPQVGADILASVPFPYPVVSLILSHHERWDGRGYPSGLRENDIPLGARILAISDYYEALTSERPDHGAMSGDAAAALLQREAGKALDPHLVKIFLRILPGLRAELRAGTEDLSRPQIPLTAGSVSPSREAPSVFDDIALAHREIYALYQIAQTMGTSLGVADTMALISSKLANLVPFSACTLFLYVEASDTLQCRFATGIEAGGLESLTVQNGRGLNGWVARNRRPLVNARPGADLEAAGVERQTSLQSALVCPLVFGERLIGTLAVYHTALSYYREDHRRLLDRVCEQAAAVIHNAIVFEQTQEDSLTDPLTGLPNTRFMLIHMASELARAERLKAEVSVLVIDLDDFKAINDHHGHHVGDRALRDVAAALRSTIRPYDVCARYAGDEFIVVLSGCGREEARLRRDELHMAVDQIVLETRPGMVIPIAMSTGAAVFPHDGDSYETLLAKADSRMYSDKSARKRERTRPVPMPAMSGAVASVP
ncbi:MAG: HD domain-containing phosphohydrolase [Vicinamibacterales bacterium]